MLESPTHNLGRDVIDQMGMTILMAPEQLLRLPLIETDINPQTWETQRNTDVS